ncbi:hypothetical protein [Chryseobacterium carnipullorum]|uniref:Uncharacterized protein n=1 Tax=Chryseobacterium carnipullorum TaxID=1124835 RepID=A0A376DRR7_CHRCU|nr:hypothetical protein [Chryseobacterium carnipullorum]STC94266.1 Uncharacterised protein [Chryseobacterium carnipullorum]
MESGGAELKHKDKVHFYKVISHNSVDINCVENDGNDSGNWKGSE